MFLQNVSRASVFLIDLNGRGAAARKTEIFSSGGVIFVPLMASSINASLTLDSFTVPPDLFNETQIMSRDNDQL